ncbi:MULTISPECIES: FTR1 family protein [Neobacillus]|jgi:high-affinity iron transporter|uniref:FTR1 family iron permease n=1 Tax=Neobacillus sedimentimangrovi TaxID=2699460 RepID=A0ABS8QGN5_9BACI|nr:FTR1 family protein [Neobacillus sedimentimangrovi]MCD4838361.1 FTR1 family iron permease [Neobacillus sedimentimangrovi]
MMKTGKILLLLFMLLLPNAVPSFAAQNHDELFVLIGDSLMKAKAGDVDTAAKNMEQFAQEWESIKNTNSQHAKKVNKELKNVQSLLANPNTDSQAVTKSLSSLSTALVLYDQEQNPVDKNAAKEQVKQLLPLIDRLKDSLADGDPMVLKSRYQAIMNQWTASEKAVHDESIVAYGQIEKYMALIRIAITQEPADLQKAKQSADQLTKEVNNFLSGKSATDVNESYSLTDVATLLDNAKKAIANKEYEKASTDLNEILTIWPMVEGEVQTRDSKLYNDIETNIPASISLINSKNIDQQKAESIVQDLSSRLAPLTAKTNYTFWDASLILLREGLEAMLIVGTLIAFLKKMGHANKQKWIWGGVAAGILGSAILAIIINMAFSKIVAASSREYIEGLTGVAAVIMMLTIGAWLHNKSNIGNWKKFIEQQMHQAIAKGSLLSFAVISFFSVFREGAETIIFYTGITPYISLQQLALGIVLAIGILAVIGFIIIHYSVKIPIRLFFKAAAILIYLLAFKIIGVSIHALQISNILSTSTVQSLPYIDWIGMYPTWETFLTQLLLIVIILFTTWFVKKSAAKNA